MYGSSASSSQSLTELKFIRATHGVITNARADHLDVMGPSEKDVALALLGTVPSHGKLFTAERDYLEKFRDACNDRSTECVTVEPSDIDAVTADDMSPFSYVEHKENVALVLKVCASIGVPRDVALKGMWATPPDPGVMSECFTAQALSPVDRLQLHWGAKKTWPSRCSKRGKHFSNRLFDETGCVFWKASSPRKALIGA